MKGFGERLRLPLLDVADLRVLSEVQAGGGDGRRVSEELDESM